ncbi:MAG TPA: nucleoside-triphosphatase [Bacteroidales bacterium]|nr:nucleoside-triphosphatase [Bacteroidales bacterium]
MMALKKIDNIWLKASVLGCLWASSEIVIGSFLHNLRVPFCGNILTGIGIIIMVSVGQIWTERGLFWRTGLVCALMKSISPSAIIFGPMIAIFTEALIMEASTFIFRKSMFSFLVGSALAMLWNLVQLLLSYVITYGSNIIYLFEKLTENFQRQLGFAYSNYWWPVEIIAIFYILAGMVAGGIGLYIGKKSKKTNLNEQGNFTNNTEQNISRINKQPEGNFSLGLLICNIIIMIVALNIFSFKNILLSVITVIIVATFWIIKYPKVLRPLKKPGFWIFLVLTTTLSAYLFTNITTGKNNGWIIGAEMNLRAIVMILGFAVVGKELRNPVIGKCLYGIGFKQLPVALELAFESLPAVISNVPGWKDITRKPFSSFLTYVKKADLHFKEQEVRIKNDQRIIVLTGKGNVGKTSFLEKIITILKEEGRDVRGILSVGVLEQNYKTGYNLLNISTGEEKLFIKDENFPESTKFRKFYFSNDGLKWGMKILESEINFDSQILIIDEIGPWELEEGGWAESLNKLAAHSKYKMIWVVREEILTDVIGKWNLKNPVIIDVSKTRVSEAQEKILKFFL